MRKTSYQRAAGLSSSVIVKHNISKVYQRSKNKLIGIFNNIVLSMTSRAPLLDKENLVKNIEEALPQNIFVY